MCEGRGVAQRLLALDAPSLYFRAFHGIPETVTAPDGTPVNAVRGFLDFIARLVKDRQPTRLVAAMDATWRPAFRTAAIPSYKAHRMGEGDAEQVPPGIVPQVPVIEQALDLLGIARIGVQGYEADDVLGTVVERASCPVDVVTGDRDLLQLVDDARQVRIFYTVPKGVGAAEPWDEAKVSAKYGIPGRAYADFATLRGDPSDGLPGVPGVGEKTAATLITRFKTLDALLAALDSGDPAIAGSVRSKLTAARDYLAVAPVVVQVARDVPLPEHDDTLPPAPRDPDGFAALVERWGLGGAADRLLAALAEAR
nr:5'-3' exonuclease [Motilibacter aurantiacus]